MKMYSYKWVIVILFMKGLQGEDLEADDERVNVLLTEIDELKAGNEKILHHLSVLTNSVRRIEGRININYPVTQKEELDVIKPIANGNVEQSLETIDKRLRKIESFLSETIKRNKEIVEKLGSKNKDSGNNVKSPENGLPDEMRKEISERISSEFVQTRNWLLGTVERLGETEKKCSALTKDIISAKDQCLDKLKQELKNQNSQDFQEEVRKNISRVERSLKEELEKIAHDIEQKVRSPVEQEQVQVPITPKPTVFILPTLPTTEKPKFPVSIPCNNKILIKKPQDCAELNRKGGVTCDGTYLIFPKKKKSTFALCDMNTLGGGWTVILKRGPINNKPTNFDQKWSAYKRGFGRTQQEFWIGNENLHHLTCSSENNHSQELLLQLESSAGEEFGFLFDYMYIEDENNNYRIHIGNVSGNYNDVAKPFSLLNNRIFRTRDRNEGSENCAEHHRGGWWFEDSCDEVTSVLTAPYYNEDDFKEPWQGMLWHTWKGDLLIKSVEMKMRTKEKA